MSAFKYFNVTTASDFVLAAIETPDGNNAAQIISSSPKCITICNTDATGDDCSINLFLVPTSGSNVRLLHKVILPAGTTLFLNKTELEYDTTVYALKFNLSSVSSSQQVDIKVTY